MGYFSRRQFLASNAATGMPGAVLSLPFSDRPALAMPTATIRAGARVIDVNGRAVMVVFLCLIACPFVGAWVLVIERQENRASRKQP